jgi:glycerate kinase
MHRSRGAGMAGALGITYLDIQAYSQLKQIHFEGWELDAIRYLDILFLNSQSEK